jgi:hypothetical protein
MNPEFNDSLNLDSLLLGKSTDNYNFLTPNPPKAKSPQSQSALQELLSKNKTKSSNTFKREIKKLRSITLTRDLTGEEEVRFAELTRREEEARIKENSKVKRNKKNPKSFQAATNYTLVSDSEASLDTSALDQEILKPFFDPSPFLDNNFDLGTDILAAAADSIARNHLVVITDGTSQEQITNSDSNKGANSLTQSQAQTATSISQNEAANSTIDLESQRLSSNCFRPPKKSFSFSQFQKAMSSKTNHYRNQNSSSRVYHNPNLTEEELAQQAILNRQNSSFQPQSLGPRKTFNPSQTNQSESLSRKGFTVKVVLKSNEFKAKSKNDLENYLSQFNIFNNMINQQGHLLLYPDTMELSNKIMNDTTIFEKEYKINLGRDYNPFLIKNITIEEVNRNQELKKALEAFGITGFDKVSKNSKESSGLIKAFAKTREQRLQLLETRFKRFTTFNLDYELEIFKVFLR